LLCLVKPPRWLWKLLLGRVRASGEPQPLYPRLGVALRTLYLARRAAAHLARMDFSIFPGWAGYVFWRLGLVGLWWRRFTRRPPRPERPAKWRSPVAEAPAVGVLSPSPARADGT
jgi:hypothetical protein